MYAPSIWLGCRLFATEVFTCAFEKPVANKAQQEFLITTVDAFKLESVSFDLDHATVTNGSLISTQISKTNASEETKVEQINVAMSGNETSYFSEISGNLKLNISNPNNVKFPRPIAVAGKAVILDNTVSDAVYSNVTQKILKTVHYNLSMGMKPRSLLNLTAKFHTFNLSVPYVATANFQGREVKIKGTWRGYAIADPTYYAPVIEARFYDIETGEPLN